MSIPDEKRCLELLDEYRLPEGIVEHSRLVAEVAVFLAEAVNRAAASRGAAVVPVDVELVRAGALLHDIGKTTAWVVAPNHAENGARIVEKEGHAELAEIVRRHLVDAVLEPARALRTWEEKLVFYADKVVTRQVLPVVERFADLRKRYPKLNELFDRAEPLVLELENEIFAGLGLTPEELPRRFS